MPGSKFFETPIKGDHMTEIELKKKANELYNQLRELGLSHYLALNGAFEYILGNVAHVDASNDAEKGPNSPVE